MTAVATTISALSGSLDFKAGNKKFRFRTITTDTGDYPTDGIAITASQIGMKKFAAVIPQGLLYDNAGGDQYDLGRPFGIRFDSVRETVYLMLYESAGDGDALDQKPAEAMTVSSVDILFIGH